MKWRIFQSIEEIPQESWQNLEPQNFPFWDYEFLQVLEKSRSIGGKSGWSPHYLTMWENDFLVAAVPLFEKTHSYGEYIFDWAWAEAYHRYNLSYYPKLISAVPFTPATGPKLLISKSKPQLEASILQESLLFMKQQKESGLHFLFIPHDEISHYQEQGFTIRHSYQYHWRNQGYQNFDDFLASLHRKRRQQIRSERNKAQKLPLKIQTLRGQEIQPEHLEAMWKFYRNTSQDKNAIPYLQPAFFTDMPESLKEHCLLILAQENEEWVAGALFFDKGKNLYGRYWGSKRDYPFLHFELCYYRPIEWAITEGFQLFEAGAQGEHKILRGFLPTLTYSAHWIVNEEFRKAINAFIQTEKQEIRLYFQDLENLNPYS